MIDEDVGKYKKKKESNVSKAKRKSKHKHEYIDCLLIDKDDKPHKAKYCKICGKIDDIKFFEAKKLENNKYLVLEDEEIFNKYKDLEKFYVNSLLNKYVILNKGD